MFRWELNMISVAVSYVVNHAEKAKRRYDMAARAGLVASSQFLLSEIKKAYDDYYTTGEYRSTLQIRAAWRRSTPQKDKDGWYAIVGVPTASVVPKGGKTPVDRGAVALYWEIGFNNPHSGKRYHVPIAGPTAAKASKGMEEAWARVVKRYMEAP